MDPVEQRDAEEEGGPGEEEGAPSRDEEEDDYDEEEDEEIRRRLVRFGLNDVVEPIMDGSFQDDFDDIHSDYQWFTESGFAGVSSSGASGRMLLDTESSYSTPLCIGVGTDLEFDATMAHIDMEDFQSGDILLRLPPLCASDLQPSQGETIASITGSILQQFNFESSITTNSHSVEGDPNQSMDMSICKSENLFSPMTENQEQQLPLSTFSTDSLDTRGETILATCMTNRNNYTIAFQGTEMEDSVASSTYRTAEGQTIMSPMSGGGEGSSDIIMENDTSSCMTNWRQIKQSKSNNSMNRNLSRGQDNNNGSNPDSRDTSNLGLNFLETRTLLTQSCPNPWYWKRISGSAINQNSNFRTQTAAFVKIYDVHASRALSTGGKNNNSSMTESNAHMIGGSAGSSTRTENQNLSSTACSSGSSRQNMYSNIMEESWNNNRNPNPNPFRIRTKFEKARPTTTTELAEAIRRSRSIQIQTSTIKLVPRKSDGTFAQGRPATAPTKSTAPVYICFPRYALPDLSFLQGCENDQGLYLLPQHYKVPQDRRDYYSSQHETGRQSAGTFGGRRTGRPMSCNDIETLRQKGLSHVRDWPSLNFLLPAEYQTILQGIRGEEPEPDYRQQHDPRQQTVPLSGPVAEPVVMRRKTGPPKARPAAQRFSLNEPLTSPSRHRGGMTEKFKRFSLQETLPEVAEITTEIAKNLEQLESLATNFGQEFFSNSNNASTTLGVDSANSSTTSNRPGAPQNTPKQGSYADFDNHFTKAMVEEGAAKIVAHVAPMRSRGSSPSKHSRHYVDIAEKQSLTEAVVSAVGEIQEAWTPATLESKVKARGLSTKGRHLGSYPNLLIMSESKGGKLVLDSLCPALYTLLSDGLCPHLETIFGRVPNTVWRVVEASIQYGPTAQTLNELVLRINSEEMLAEGPMKLNAFVCGLLNLGNLGSWLTFLRTKERLLRTHFESDSLMYTCNTTTRYLYDQMLVTIHQLAKLPFQLDIFHETKLLHQSMIPQGNKSPFSLPLSRKNSAKHTRASPGSTAPGGIGVANVRKSSSADTRTPKALSKASKHYYANQLKKSQMKRSFSDERPKVTKPTSNSTLPKSKTAQNIVQNEGKPPASKLFSALARFPSKPKISSITSPDRDNRTGAEGGGPGGKPPVRPKTIEPESDEGSKDPDRFRRLQMQWELLSSDEARKVSPGSPGGFPGVSPISAAHNNPSFAGSKIPRPITSPIRAHPVLSATANVRPTSKR